MPILFRQIGANLGQCWPILRPKLAEIAPRTTTPTTRGPGDRGPTGRGARGRRLKGQGHRRRGCGGGSAQPGAELGAYAVPQGNRSGDLSASQLLRLLPKPTTKLKRATTAESLSPAAAFPPWRSAARGWRRCKPACAYGLCVCAPCAVQGASPHGVRGGRALASGRWRAPPP